MTCDVETDFALASGVNSQLVEREIQGGVDNPAHRIFERDFRCCGVEDQSTRGGVNRVNNAIAKFRTAARQGRENQQ